MKHNGKCVFCGAMPIEGADLCLRCHQAHRRRQQAEYHTAKDIDKLLGDGHTYNCATAQVYNHEQCSCGAETYSRYSYAFLEDSYG